MTTDLNQRNGKHLINNGGAATRHFTIRHAGPTIAIMEDRAALPSDYERNALRNGAERAGLSEPFAFSPNEVDLLISGREKPNILINGEPFESPDVVLVRTGAGTSEFGFRVLEALATNGTRVINALEPTALAADKFRSLNALAAAGLPVARTWLAHDYSARRLNLVTKVLGFPLVLKPRSGAQGSGVALMENKVQLRAALEQQPPGTHILQQYMSNSPGKDLRVLVIGGCPVAACCRVSRTGEWRSNCTLGAGAIPVPLTREIARLAVLAAQTLGCEVCGVDLLFGDDESFVIGELNGSPGFKSLQRCHPHVDLAAEIIDYLLLRFAPQRNSQWLN